ncbi:hypothetical protein [Sinimarinibacterium sp. NLF-5-8]|uniref:hypothetical protein n=1 Tax=Sinimarinibacterium sp. NLF-5-8 TaxID=2698684 RepID=UPI00137C2137|nr:hypothetical protein [Sinimarinibacterium sp. NLF-5-8]QHS10466.1 hypothetical protein GT972_10220 [Sinimarinibacterium sp. NLF-5-8]
MRKDDGGGRLRARSPARAGVQASRAGGGFGQLQAAASLMNRYLNQYISNILFKNNALFLFL